ncbi:hypothetical protein [Paraburkholderia lycopersici]|uniref:Uncharacterized protein n=1 Tax=Paraburkholderia lycopersici TaxID=416944 RepID=A0A1G6Z0T4_9BURK|nr:hypothetical protein [Paraburkholderia lycopersici]SDD96220.1 hypothetical protein SAMN05421548_12939 [Paraburkholderia lycopersici]
MFGIDVDRRLFYEGSPSLYGFGVWPSPFASVATLISQEGDWDAIPSGTPDLAWAKLIFREDAFDPVTRVRRGRLYQRFDTQPAAWHVQRHPAAPLETGGVDLSGLFVKNLYTYAPWFGPGDVARGHSPALFALGVRESYTLWTLLSVERLSTGENLVTLRARSSLGAMPDLDDAAIPAAGVDDIHRQLDRVSDAEHRQGPEAIIDACRYAAPAAIGLWLADRDGDAQFRAVDLNEHIKHLERGAKPMALLINAAKIIARLHARLKPNEEFSRGARRLTEADAEAALASMGLILRELGWARA